MLTTVGVELRARRSHLHLLALVLVLTVCLLVSALSLPSLEEDTAGAPQHLAYGYLYCPVLLAPVVASWLDDPFSPGLVQGTRRVSAVAVAWTAALLTLLATTSAVVGWSAGEPGGVRTSVENAVWVGALCVALRRRTGSQWASLIVVAFGSLGLFSPALGVLVVNREPRTSDLALGLVVVAVELGCLRSTRWAHLLV